MNRNGALTDIFLLIVVGFVFTLFSVVIIFGFGLLNTQLQNIQNPPNLNLTGAAADTIGQFSSGLLMLRAISILLIVSMMISILISNYLIKANPIFFAAHIILVIIAIIFSVYISNSYEDLMKNSILGSSFQGFSGANYIFLNLPVWIAVIGIASTIFLFIGVIRDAGTGGSII